MFHSFHFCFTFLYVYNSVLLLCRRRIQFLSVRSFMWNISHKALIFNDFMFAFVKQSNKLKHNESKSPIFLALKTSIHLTFSPERFMYIFLFSRVNYWQSLNRLIKQVYSDFFFSILYSPKWAFILPIKTGYHLSIV